MIKFKCCKCGLNETHNPFTIKRRKSNEGLVDKPQFKDKYLFCGKCYDNYLKGN